MNLRRLNLKLNLINESIHISFIYFIIYNILTPKINKHSYKVILKLRIHYM